MRRCLPLFSALPVAVLLLASACNGGGEAQGPAATLGPGPSTTSTTARPIDPAVIPEDPADIDEAYVQAVVDALFEVDAKATKIFVETKAPDDRAIEYLRAIYVPDELDRQLNIWFQSLAQRADELLPGVLHNSVTRVINISEDCVYVEVESDYSDVTERDVSPSMNYLGLTSKAAADDLEGLNPTAWMLFMDGVNLDGSPPEDPCQSR